MGHSARYSSAAAAATSNAPGSVVVVVVIVAVPRVPRDNCFSFNTDRTKPASSGESRAVLHLIVAISVAICFCEILTKRSAPNADCNDAE